VGVGFIGLGVCLFVCLMWGVSRVDWVVIGMRRWNGSFGGMGGFDLGPLPRITQAPPHLALAFMILLVSEGY